MDEVNLVLAFTKYCLTHLRYLIIKSLLVLWKQHGKRLFKRLFTCFHKRKWLDDFLPSSLLFTKSTSASPANTSSFDPRLPLSRSPVLHPLFPFSGPLVYPPIPCLPPAPHLPPVLHPPPFLGPPPALLLVLHLFLLRHHTVLFLLLLSLCSSVLNCLPVFRLSALLRFSIPFSEGSRRSMMSSKANLSPRSENWQATRLCHKRRRQCRLTMLPRGTWKCNQPTPSPPRCSLPHWPPRQVRYGHSYLHNYGTKFCWCSVRRRRSVPRVILRLIPDHLPRRRPVDHLDWWLNLLVDVGKHIQVELRNAK